MKTTRFYLLPILLLGLFLSGCDTTANDEDGEAMLNLNVQAVVNGTPFISGQTYDINGTTTTFTGARMYISEITLLHEDGTTYSFEGDAITVPAKDADDNDITHTVTDKVVLFKHDADMDTHTIGMAPEGRYTGMVFKVGIGGTNNRVDASQVPATHPMAKQTDLNNHWNWSAGYIYLRMDGQVDTDADGNTDESWEVHLGRENFLTEVQLDREFELVADEHKELHVMVNYATFLADVDLTNPLERNTHVGDNLPMAQKVGGMIDDAFMFHGVHDADGGHQHGN